MKKLMKSFTQSINLNYPETNFKATFNINTAKVGSKIIAHGIIILTFNVNNTFYELRFIRASVEKTKTTANKLIKEVKWLLHRMFITNLLYAKHELNIINLVSGKVEPLACSIINK